MKLVNRLKEIDIFRRPTTKLSLDEERHLSMKRMNVIRQMDIFNPEVVMRNHKLVLSNMITLFGIDPSAIIKFIVSYNMFISTIHAMGTKKHWGFIQDALMGKVLF